MTQREKRSLDRQRHRVTDHDRKRDAEPERNCWRQTAVHENGDRMRVPEVDRIQE